MRGEKEERRITREDVTNLAHIEGRARSKQRARGEQSEG
jgi:hypothetical protein